MIDLYRGYWNCCVFDFPMLCVWVLQWKCHHYFQTITSVNAMTILQISSSKRWASTFIFFFLLLLCVVPSRLDADWGTFIKIHFIQIHIANPKPQSGPPPSQELDKILDFFPCLSLCVCLHTHTIKGYPLLIVYPHMENQWKQCTYTSSTNHCKTKSIAWTFDDKVFTTIGKYDDRDFF